MIDEELRRHFQSVPPPALSPAFSITLHRRLQATIPAGRATGAFRVWAPRLYWVAAVVLLARYWRPVPLTPLQIAWLALGAVAMIMALHRALRPGPLTRVLREALRR